MKKALLSLFVVGLVGSVWADSPAIPRIESRMTPATSSSNVTISAAGSNLRNCLTDATVISNSTYTFRVLDGTTTSYQLLMGASQGLAEDWSINNPFCGSPNSSMTLSIDSGTFRINYSGVVVRP